MFAPLVLQWDCVSLTMTLCRFSIADCPPQNPATIKAHLLDMFLNLPILQELTTYLKSKGLKGSLCLWKCKPLGEKKGTRQHHFYDISNNSVNANDPPQALLIHKTTGHGAVHIKINRGLRSSRRPSMYRAYIRWGTSAAAKTTPNTSEQPTQAMSQGNSLTNRKKVAYLSDNLQ